MSFTSSNKNMPISIFFMYLNQLNKRNFTGLVLHYCSVFRQVGKGVEYVLMEIFQFEESFVVLRRGKKRREKDLKSAGAELLKDGPRGLHVYDRTVKRVSLSDFGLVLAGFGLNSSKKLRT